MPTRPAPDSDEWYANILFPPVVSVAQVEPIPLVVDIASTPAPHGFALARRSGERIMFVVHSTSFDADPYYATSTIPEPGKPARPSIFFLTPRPHVLERLEETGGVDASIHVEAFHANRSVGSAVVECVLTPDRSAAASPSATLRPLARRTRTAAPDFTLVVREGLEGERSFTLAARARGAEEPVSAPVEFRERPRAVLGALINQLNELAADDRGDPRTREHQIEAVGRRLFEQLFPERLQQFYRLHRSRIETLVVQSAEPWIPWEVVRPFGNMTNEGFLCEKHVMARLPATGMPEAPGRLDTAVWLTPGDLGTANQELEQICAVLRGAEIEVQQIEDASYLDLIEVVNASVGPSVLHIAAHGVVPVSGADEPYLRLGDERFRPRDLLGDPKMTHGPLVFINSCNSSATAMTLTGLGGFATAFIAKGASTFVGAHWDVTESLASVFAPEFYKNLVREETLGESLRRARLAVRQRNPGNPTWLAYCLYGDPNVRLARGVG